MIDKERTKQKQRDQESQKFLWCVGKKGRDGTDASFLKGSKDLRKRYIGIWISQEEEEDEEKKKTKTFQVTVPKI
jgi:hypothetical protein